MRLRISASLRPLLARRKGLTGESFRNEPTSGCLGGDLLCCGLDYFAPTLLLECSLDLRRLLAVCLR